jgi:hypothetical protein
MRKRAKARGFEWVGWVRLRQQRSLRSICARFARSGHSPWLACHERAWRLATSSKPGESNGGERGIRTLRERASNSLMARDFWRQRSLGQSVAGPLSFAAVTPGPLESTGVVETFWRRWQDPERAPCPADVLTTWRGVRVWRRRERGGRPSGWGRQRRRRTRWCLPIPTGP